jgi:putative transposase
MKRSKFTDEQILAIVREGEAGRKVADLVRTHGITEQTYYRWKAKYGGMELSEMQRLNQLEDENQRLKQIEVDRSLPGARVVRVLEHLRLTIGLPKGDRARQRTGVGGARAGGMGVRARRGTALHTPGQAD